MPVEITPWTPLPMGARSDRRLFAIGDIHGFTAPFNALRAHLRSYIGSGSGALLVYIGDYVDRGPDPRGALALVAEGLGTPGLEEIALRGNHDQYLIDAAQLEYGRLDFHDLSNWLTWGGAQTLDALRVSDDAMGERLARKLQDALGDALCDFLAARPYRHDIGDFTFVHAGLNPKFPFDEQDNEEVIWIRHPFLNCKRWPFSSVVVHGHTPEAPAVHAHRIGIDIGVFLRGELAAVEIEGARARFHIYSP